VLTACDEEDAATYCRILDAEAVRADWREVARIALHIDHKPKPIAPAELSTATWARENGFRER